MRKIDIVEIDGKSYIATIKKVDSMGRVQIPKSFRTPMHLDVKDIVSVTLKEPVIVIKPF